MRQSYTDKVKSSPLKDKPADQVIAELRKKYDPKLMGVGLKLLKNWMKAMSR